jgi:type IV pilus assembly protein PilB
MAIIKTNLKLGELLVKSGLITQEQLSRALEVQYGTRKRIGEVLVELGILTEQDIVVALSRQLGIPCVSASSALLSPNKDQGLQELIPLDFARKNRVLPVARDGKNLTVACVDPLDLITMDNLSRITHCQISQVITTNADLELAIDRFYGGDAMLREAIGKSYDSDEEAKKDDEEGEIDVNRMRQEAEDAPVIRLVDLIVKQAIKERASDIHIEPFSDHVSLRYRIDGSLVEMAPPSKKLDSAIVSRIKILCKLDIAEKRLPQDGAFRMVVDGKPVDFRVSTVPSIYGEKVVIRILDKSAGLIDLGRLGFASDALERFRQALHNPHGLILVTGPTGSGKSTTLYAALNEIHSPTRNIMTIEDPVEYRLDGINQIQVKPQIGLTFASGLRAFMRQDPDIIMVGETRDLETAEICLRASLTGHLVFTTLHTNDAPSSITRLMDMGIPPFLLSSTVRLIVAQRLLRRLCEYCKEAYEPMQQIREQFDIAEELLYRPKGCEKCSNIGYKGRVGCYEVMAVDRELREAIARGSTSLVLKDLAIAQGMSTLWDEGLRKVREGLTSLEELQAVILLED